MNVQHNQRAIGSRKYRNIQYYVLLKRFKRESLSIKWTEMKGKPPPNSQSDKPPGLWFQSEINSSSRRTWTIYSGNSSRTETGVYFYSAHAQPDNISHKDTEQPVKNKCSCSSAVWLSDILLLLLEMKNKSSSDCFLPSFTLCLNELGLWLGK